MLVRQDRLYRRPLADFLAQRGAGEPAVRIMDVKELRSKDAGNSPQTAGSRQNSLVQKSLKTLSAQNIDASRADPVRIDVEARNRSIETGESRERANRFISVINFVVDATDEIEKLIKSVDGIVEQADSDLPEQRVDVLQREANDLVAEIRKKAQSSAPDGSRPLAGDKVELKEVDKALELLLPDDAKDAFGIGTIEISNKEAILQTRRVVQAANQRVKELQNTVSQAKEQVGNVVAEIEVALANQEASTSTVRDVDKALSVVNELGGRILAKPEEALSSVGSIEQSKAQRLLE